MKKKIAILCAVYYSAQLLLIFIISYSFNLKQETFFIFAGYLSLWIGIIYLFLLLREADFCSTDESLVLTKINSANKITIFRLSSIPLTVFLFSNTEIYTIKIILMIFLSIVFLTDFADGYIARKKHQQTRIGQMLDSMSDYALLALISIIYKHLELLPSWFFYLILGRLFFQGVGVALFLILDFPLPAVSTIGGKITIAATMTFYTSKMLQFFISISKNMQNIFQIFEYVCAFIIFVFIFEKINIFYIHWKKYLQSRTNK